MAKKAKKNDAIMTGILVTRFKMGLINVEDLEQMAEDMSVVGEVIRCKEGTGKDILPNTLARARAATTAHIAYNHSWPEIVI